MNLQAILENGDGNTLDAIGRDQSIKVTQIEYSDGPMKLPNGMSYDQAIELLKRRKKYETEETNFLETFDVFPWDGAHAINVVLKEKFGWASQTPTPGFFGDTPPAMITVEVGPNLFTQVPWGSFSLPGVAGRMETGVGAKDGRMCFQLSAVVQRKDEATIQDIFARVRSYLNQNSIYRGQAIKIRFRDDNGKKIRMPEPKFMDLNGTHEDMVIYSDDVQAQVKTNLFVPVTRVHDCLLNDIAIKRGVILGGPYGTGKTMAAMVAAKLATDNGITFVYVAHADELSDALKFAQQYQSPACVVFCEDIDRSVSGERSVAMDDILNLIDGIDTKKANIITVLTTNHLENINAAMLRPGRLDAVIEVLPPDAKAVVRLIQLYAGEALDPRADLADVGVVLSGQIPAVIAEVVKRAKLAQLGLQSKGTKVEKLTTAALLTSARSMRSQIDLLKRQSEKKPEEKPFESMFRNMILESFGDLPRKVNEIHSNVV